MEPDQQHPSCAICLFDWLLETIPPVNMQMYLLDGVRYNRRERSRLSRAPRLRVFCCRISRNSSTQTLSSRSCLVAHFTGALRPRVWITTVRGGYRPRLQLNGTREDCKVRNWTPTASL